jgi:hypothetical protein
VQHDRASGDIDRTNPRALPVLLIRDRHPILVYALASKDSSFQRVLPDVGEYFPVNPEMGENLLPLVKGGVAHVVFTSNVWKRSRSR